MRLRRGSLHHTELSRMIEQFKPGMYVVSTYISSPGDSLRGIVQSIDDKAKKVYVAWNGGAVKQHDADELMPATMPVIQQPASEGNTMKNVVMDDTKKANNLNIKHIVAKILKEYL